MSYCPYTDRDIAEDQTNSEHIIPLSLGGVNGFELPVDRKFNSEAGSSLDGALANEFIWALARTKYDTRGHSGRPPLATIKRATYTDDCRPAQAHFHHHHGISLWDARHREYMTGKGNISIGFKINIDLPMRFTAKVALAAGYYVYGDLFRHHVDHRQLRDVMNTDLSELDLEAQETRDKLSHIALRVDTFLDELPNDPESAVFCLRNFCASVDGSVVVLMPGQDCFGVGVGLLGRYLAMVNVPANTEYFPNSGEYAWGHVLSITNKELERCSWMAALKRWLRID